MGDDPQCCPHFPRDIATIETPRAYIKVPREVDFLFNVVVAPGGAVFVSDFGKGRVHAFNKKKEYLTSFGSKEDADKEKEGILNVPSGMAVDSNGLVYVASLRSHRIVVFRKDGTFVRQFRSSKLNCPTSVAVYNDLLYVADIFHHRISVFTLQGEHLRFIGEEGGGPGQFRSPTGIAFSPDGYMYVADIGNERVQVFTCNGHFRREFGRGLLDRPTGILITAAGDILVADKGNDRVVVFNACGNAFSLVHSIDVEGPCHIAIDKGGNILVTHKQGIAIF